METYFTEFIFASIEQGVRPGSPLGLFLLGFGILFTIGLPVLMITKGKSEDS
tara:strand:- start:494 stop:649 length:156 start_codon:yes stop_codon:yes gene_type:complete